MDRSVAWAQIVATEWTSQKKIGHLLLRMTAGELHLRCGSEVKERRLQRLGHGVAKVCFSIEGTEQVLKLVPKAGQNRQGWHSGGLNDPIAEFKAWKMAWAKHESLRPHLPYYSEAFYLGGILDGELTYLRGMLDGESMGPDVEAGAMICTRAARTVEDIFRQGVVQSCTLGAWREHYRWWGKCFQLVGFFLEFGLCLWDAKADNFGISVRDSDLLLVIDVWPIREREQQKPDGPFMRQMVNQFCAHFRAQVLPLAHTSWQPHLEKVLQAITAVFAHNPTRTTLHGEWRQASGSPSSRV